MVTQRLLDLQEVHGAGFAGCLALCVHEVDYDDLALNQIFIEPHCLIILGFQRYLGQLVRPLFFSEGMSSSADSQE